MANWKNKLRLTDLKQDYESKKITLQEFGKKINERIKSLPCYEEEEDNLAEIVYSFNEVLDIEDFDNILEQLYDWADCGHICWVETF